MSVLSPEEVLALFIIVPLLVTFFIIFVGGAFGAYFKAKREKALTNSNSYELGE